MAAPTPREVVEQMLMRRMGRMAPPRVVAFDEDTVGELACKRYDILVNDEVSQEICARDPWELPLDSEAFDTFGVVAEYYELLRRASPHSGAWAPPRTMRGIEGFPIRTIIYKGQLPLSEWVLQSVEERAIDAAQFTLPPNLRNQEITQMPPGR
jgi:hypothetical protein